MKRFVLSLFLAGILFSSCKKDRDEKTTRETYYLPDSIIVRRPNETFYNKRTYDGRLIKTHILSRAGNASTWRIEYVYANPAKGLLDRIDYFRNDSNERTYYEDFEYDYQNRLTRVKFNVFYSGQFSILHQYDYAYQNGDMPSQITETKYVFGTNQIDWRKIARLTYDGDNLRHIVWYDVQDMNTPEKEIWYSHDDHKNPYADITTKEVNLFTNNITRKVTKYYTNPNLTFEVLNYEINYNDQSYPETIRLTDSMGVERETRYYFYIKYEE